MPAEIWELYIYYLTSSFASNQMPGTVITFLQQMRNLRHKLTLLVQDAELISRGSLESRVTKKLAGSSLVAQTEKNLPAMWETWI